MSFENWHESDRRCPECGSPVEEGDWTDYDSLGGGAIIGSAWRCTNCRWTDWE